MMNEKQVEAALRQALEAFEILMSKHDEDIGMDDHQDDDSVGWYGNGDPMELTFGDLRRARSAITALRRALEQQPADEPACWDGDDKCPNRQACCDAEECLYTRPQPAAQWVGLTAQQQREGMAQPHRGSVGVQEAKLREKNGGKA